MITLQQDPQEENSGIHNTSMEIRRVPCKLFIVQMYYISAKWNNG